MPRRRPGSLRAAVPTRRRHRLGGGFPVPGLSGAAGAEIAVIEQQRCDLYPGGVAEMFGQWAWFVRLPRRRLWDPSSGPPSTTRGRPAPCWTPWPAP
ncbi:hypothetical protein SUDANB121_01170 [Nocardiopsis dassonvillei]|uniref:hypothetical protein n=1 Tax=Nocardiopsis dassonvillei TaxID=2014 RepID=UPI003F569B78